MLGLLFVALLQAGQPRMPVVSASGWTSGGLDGGRVIALATGSDGAVYAGALGGLFRSADGDLSWTRLDFPVGANSTVTWIGVAPSDPTVVYAAETTPDIPSHGHVIGMYRSGDGGTTWTSIAYIQDDFITKFNVAFDPTDALTLYLSINCCSSKSTNGGTTWMGLTPDMTSIAVDPSSPSTLYGNAFVADRPGHAINHLQKSTDAGASWTPTGLVTENEFLVVDPDDPSVLYAIGAPFARSDDGGLSITTETTSPGPVSSLMLGGGSPRRLYARVFQGSGYSLYTSVDRGTTWTTAGAPPGGVEGWTVAPIGTNGERILAGGGERGAFESTDGGATWAARSAGLDATYVDRIAVFPADGRIAYALGPGLAKTENGGATWSVDPFAPVASHGGLAVDPTDPDIVCAADATAGVRRSKDGGATWSPASSTGRFVSSIAVDLSHPSTVYAADGRPLKSLDGGTTWDVVGTGIPDGVTRIAVDPSNDEILYAIIGSPYPPSSFLYRSTDAGQTWNQAFGFVDSIAPDPGHPGTVYASSFFAYRSLDYGATWSQMSSNTEIELGDLACDANGIVYAASRSAIPQLLGTGTPLRSDDRGATFSPIAGWGEFAVGFPFRTNTVAVDRSGSALYAGTDRGVWEISSRRPRPIARPQP